MFWEFIDLWVDTRRKSEKEDENQTQNENEQAVKVRKKGNTLLILVFRTCVLSLLLICPNFLIIPYGLMISSGVLLRNYKLNFSIWMGLYYILAYNFTNFNRKFMSKLRSDDTLRIRRNVLLFIYLAVGGIVALTNIIDHSFHLCLYGGATGALNAIVFQSAESYVERYFFSHSKTYFYNVLEMSKGLCLFPLVYFFDVLISEERYAFSQWGVAISFICIILMIFLINISILFSKKCYATRYYDHLIQMSDRQQLSTNPREESLKPTPTDIYSDPQPGPSTVMNPFDPLQSPSTSSHSSPPIELQNLQSHSSSSTPQLSHQMEDVEAQLHPSPRSKSKSSGSSTSNYRRVFSWMFTCPQIYENRETEREREARRLEENRITVLPRPDEVSQSPKISIDPTIPSTQSTSEGTDFCDMGPDLICNPALKHPMAKKFKESLKEVFKDKWRNPKLLLPIFTRIMTQSVGITSLMLLPHLWQSIYSSNPEEKGTALEMLQWMGVGWLIGLIITFIYPIRKMDQRFFLSLGLFFCGVSFSVCHGFMSRCTVHYIFQKMYGVGFGLISRYEDEAYEKYADTKIRKDLLIFLEGVTGLSIVIICFVLVFVNFSSFYMLQYAYIPYFVLSFLWFTNTCWSLYQKKFRRWINFCNPFR